MNHRIIIAFIIVSLFGFSCTTEVAQKSSAVRSSNSPFDDLSSVFLASLWKVIFYFPREILSTAAVIMKSMGLDSVILLSEIYKIITGLVQFINENFFPLFPFL